MSIIIKTPSQIKKIKDSCKITSDILFEIIDYIKEGISTLELDLYSRKLFKKYKVKPAFLNFSYPPYPATICTSVNEVVVHGIPNDYVLKQDDIVTIDVGVNKDKYIGDSAYTIRIGKKPDKLMKICLQALYCGINQAYAGNKIGNISNAIQTTINTTNYGIVTQGYGGHGVGLSLHEDPLIYNKGEKNTGDELKPGMIIAIEPMVTKGSPLVSTLPDKWSVAIVDGSDSAHYEHTILITDKEPEILTYFK